MINRLIAPLLIKDGYLVQSKCYQWHLPVGHVEHSAMQFQYFDIDEFTLISLDGMADSKVDTNTLSRLRSVVSHPITYAGGVVNLEQLKIAFDVGADRVILNRLLNGESRLIESFANLVGQQGIVGSFDILLDNKGECYVRSFDRTYPLSVDYISSISSIVGEVNLGLIDWEGSDAPLQQEKMTSILMDVIDKVHCPVTLYGGSRWLNYHNLSIDSEHKVSVIIDNILSYKEDSVYEFRSKLQNM